MPSSESKWVRTPTGSITRPCAVCGADTPYCHKMPVTWKEAGAELMTWFREWRCTDHAPRLHRYLQAQADSE